MRGGKPDRIVFIDRYAVKTDALSGLRASQLRRRYCSTSPIIVIPRKNAFRKSPVTEDSPTPAQRVLVQGTGPFVLAEHGAIDSEVCGRCQRRRMIVAENLPPARQRVLLQRAWLLMSAQYAKFDGKVTCRNECVRVVVAKDSAAPHESVLMEAARLLVFTHFAQVDGETAGELKGVVGRVRSGTCR